MNPKEVKVTLEERAPFGPCHRTDSTRAGRSYGLRRAGILVTIGTSHVNV